MKLRYLLLLLWIGPWAQSQVKIGDNPQTLDPASILELESTSRALVISRVSTAQMNTITPLRGAMVYNTDADCLYYYNGTSWINLCEASGGAFTFTTDPVVNPISTIEITQTGNNYNFEVGEITGNNIVDGSINGFTDIQDGTISSSKLQDRAVGPKKLEEGAVSSFEIEDQSILTLDIAPEGPDQVLSTDTNGIVQWQDKGSLSTVADQVTITGQGIPFDPIKVSDNITGAIVNNTTNINTNTASITANTAALATKENVANKNTDINLGTSNTLYPTQNAVKTYVDNALATGGANGSETKINAGANIGITGAGTTPNPYVVTNTFTEVDGSITNELITNAVLRGTTLVITEAGVDYNVDLSTLGGGGGGTGDGSETIINSSPTVTVNGTGTLADPYLLTSLGGADGSETRIASTATVTVTGDGTSATPYQLNTTGGSGTQNLAMVLANGTDADRHQIKNLTDPSDPQDAATRAYVDATIVAGEADGSETIINGSPTVSVAGIGTIADPYVLTSSGGADGSETEIVDSPTITVAGNGTSLNPYILTSLVEGTRIVSTATIGVTGNGTTGTPYRLINLEGDDQIAADVPFTPYGSIIGPNTQVAIQQLKDEVDAGGGGGTTEEADQITITGLGLPTDPFKIEPSTTIGQFLSTDATGVTWVDLPAGTAPLVFDGTTISGTGVATDPYLVADNGISTVKIQDNAVTTAKILPLTPTPAADQMLITSTAGTVGWAPVPAGVGTTELADQVTITGDGQVGTEFEVADNGISTVKIQDNAVTTAKILPLTPAPATDQMLITSTAGTVGWAP
ncbi:hypothetical protein K8352_11695, partial [Flavobacteriaceae bacterium F89]|nr:hypothetical protein [Cerina litoralis]